MTKQEQIEEMVSIMAASNNPFVDVPIEIMPKVAEALYNAGCRKINDDCAVITKDELKQYKVQEVKEFAERLKAMCSDYLYDTNFDGKNDFDIHIGELSRMIDELLKEYEK